MHKSSPETRDARFPSRLLLPLFFYKPANAEFQSYRYDLTIEFLLKVEQQM